MKKINKGYQLERLGEKHGLWEILSNRPYHVEGDGVTVEGTHVQIKSQYGQITCNSWDKLENRLRGEIATQFAVGIEKGKRTEVFFFHKEDFIELVLSNKNLLKRELLSDETDYHFRLQFALVKGKLHKIKKYSYKMIAIPERLK